jgi:hypothetical protein
MKSIKNNSLLITIIAFLKVTNSTQLFPLVGVPNECKLIINLKIFLLKLILLSVR